MNENNPSNADLYQTLGTILERIEGNHKVYTREFKEIKKKQDKTNGRVTRLEKWKNDFLVSSQAVKDYKDAQITSRTLVNTPEFLNLLQKFTWLIGIIGAAIAISFGVR